MNNRRAINNHRRKTYASSRRRPPSPRRGLSLLEVVLALAILAASIAITSELVRVGSRGAVDARDLTTAQLLCENKMAEITAGIQPPDPVSRATLLEDPEWLYSIAIGQTEQEGMLAVEIMLEKNIPRNTTTVRRPLSYRLVRWMIDPEVELELMELEAEQQEAAIAAEEAAAAAAETTTP